MCTLLYLHPKYFSVLWSKIYGYLKHSSKTNFWFWSIYALLVLAWILFTCSFYSILCLYLWARVCSSVICIAIKSFKSLWCDCIFFMYSRWNKTLTKIQKSWNDVLTKQLNPLAQKILYGRNVVLFYYILNREMINYSHVPPNVFTKHFLKNFKWKSRANITSYSSSFDGDVDLRP